MRIILICLLFSISLIACYLPYSPFYPGLRELHKTIYLSDNLSVFERGEIRKALAEWTCATNGMVSFEVVEGTADAANNKRHAIIIKDVPTDYPLMVRENSKREDNLQTIGLSTIEDGVRTILVRRPGAFDWEYEALIIHELGHTVAMLGHSEMEDAVMFGDLSRSAMHLTQNDLNAFCGAFECELTLKAECSQ